MENNGFVYIIKCLKNGKMYVGSTINTKRRWCQHWNEIERAKSKNQKMYDDMRSFGKEQFCMYVIYEGEDYKEMEKKITIRLQPEYNIRNKTPKKEASKKKWGSKTEYHRWYYKTHKEQCKAYNKKYLQKKHSPTG